MTDNSGFDIFVQKAYDRAKNGDQRAGKHLLIYFQNALRGTGNAVLSDLTRELLADMLLSIIDGQDARVVTFTKTGSGNPAWHRQARDQHIVGEMNFRIMQGMKPWPAAKEITSQFGLAQSTINNIWLKRKDDPELAFVFFKDD